MRSSACHQGLRFDHIEVPTIESTLWLKLTNGCVVRVKSGVGKHDLSKGKEWEIYLVEWLNLVLLEETHKRSRGGPSKRTKDIS